MKITDKELLKEIWRVQLENTAKGMINRYIGGGIGLRSGDYEDRKYHSCDVHIMDRDRITKKVGYTRLLHRIRKLAYKDDVTTLMTTRTYIGGKQIPTVLTFMIECKEAKEAFDCAVNFWADKGVPSGYHLSNDGRHCSNTTKDVDYEELLPACQKMLMDKFGGNVPENGKWKL